jgi:pimeloyl-ACP methyl ester carboxylesterase
MMEIYEQKLSKWPIPYESVYVETQYGSTHLIVSGPKQATPLILLPGLAVTSAVWMPNIEVLSKEFCCYAIDVIGDYGKSELSDIRNYPRMGRDYSTWLRQVYQSLDIEKAHLMGFSHGGFAAINHAIFAPEQIEKLILVSPSGIDITLKKLLPKIFFFLLFPSPKNRENLVRWFLGENPTFQSTFYEQFNLGLQGRPKVPIPILVSGKKLQRIKAPAMLLLGGKDVAISAERGAIRMKKYLPTAHIVIIPGVGHGMNYEAPDQFNGLVLDFLGI